MSIENTIYSTAKSDGMPDLLAKFIVAQSKHETGNYTSRFFTIGNNAFGYSYVPGAKWQLDKGGPNADNGVPIAQYASVQNSVHEITDWIKRRKQSGTFPANLAEIDTPEKYAWYLKQAGYYQAPYDLYANALINWFNNLPPLAAAAGGGAILLLVLGLLYAFSKHSG